MFFVPVDTLCKLQTPDDGFFETQGKYGVRFVFYSDNLERCIDLTVVRHQFESVQLDQGTNESCLWPI